jgi:hypothetical protein
VSADLRRRIYSLEVATVTGMSRREARAWLRVNGKREGKRYHITVGELLRHYEHLRDDPGFMQDRLTLAGDIKHMRYEMQRLSLRIAQLEGAERRRRRMAQNFKARKRNARARKKKANQENDTQ